MPVVELRDFIGVPAPADHENPATMNDVELASHYKYTVNHLTLHKAQDVTIHDLAAAQLHLQDTCNSFLNAVENQPPLQPQFQQIVNMIRNEMQVQFQAVMQEIHAIQEIAVETSVMSTQNLNRFRQGGSALPLLPVRYPTGQYPEENLPPLTSLDAIRALSFPVLRAYTRSYDLNVDQHAEIEVFQRALARHVGAIP